MIQVCSRCGTRWNVRDRERTWCPRCQGTLLAPTAVGGVDSSAQTSAQASPRTPQQGPPPSPGRQPAGFRWIAVRPGPPPPSRPRRRPLGPTPRYRFIPRWGLVDPIPPSPEPVGGDTAEGASAATARAILIGAAIVLALAAGVHAVRYVLLLINRTTLLPPLIAWSSLLSGVLISLVAVVAVIAAAVTLTSWLIARRAAAFAAHGQPDPRPRWALWTGCLVPGVNLVWAPVFVLELAHAERCRERQRGPIALWWIGWVLASVICVWAIWTSRATDPQGIADNTVTVIIAYLAGLAVLVLIQRVFDGFVRRPVDRPLHRWVIAPLDQPAAEPEQRSEDRDRAEDADDEEPGPAEQSDRDVESEGVESRDREPAA